MPKYTSCIFGLAFGALGSAVHAVPVSFGTGAFVSLTNCVPVGTVCNPIFPSVERVWVAEPLATSSNAAATNAQYGTSESSSSLSGTIGAPILKAKAISEPGGRGAADTVAVQRYIYTGSETTDRIFGGTLSYIQSVAFPHNPAFPDRSTNVNAFLAIYSFPSETINVGLLPFQTYNDLISLAAVNPGAILLGLAQWQDYTSTSSGSANLSVSITLNPGDSVWVQTVLQTRAAGGGYSDASNTLITFWDNTAHLVPAVVASIPEPSTLALVCLGIGVGLRRLRQLRLSERRPQQAQSEA